MSPRQLYNKKLLSQQVLSFGKSSRLIARTLGTSSNIEARVAFIGGLISSWEATRTYKDDYLFIIASIHSDELLVLSPTREIILNLNKNGLMVHLSHDWMNYNRRVASLKAVFEPVL